MDLDGDGHIDILSGSYSRMERSMAGLFQVLYGRGRRTTALAAALGAGFGSYAQFHRVFRELTGRSPSAKRRQPFPRRPVSVEERHRPTLLPQPISAAHPRPGLARADGRDRSGCLRRG